MQEEVNDKTIALSVKTAKLAGTVLKAVLRKFLEEQAKAKQKSKTKSAEPKHGKQYGNAYLESAFKPRQYNGACNVEKHVAQHCYRRKRSCRFCFVFQFAPPRPSFL